MVSERNPRTNPFGIPEDDDQFDEFLTVRLNASTGGLYNMTESLQWLEKWNLKEAEKEKNAKPSEGKFFAIRCKEHIDDINMFYVNLVVQAVDMKMAIEKVGMVLAKRGSCYYVVGNLIGPFETQDQAKQAR